MTPKPKQAGGRPRGPNSVKYFAELHGISDKAAQRISKLHPDLISIAVEESKRLSRAIKGIERLGRKKYPRIPYPRIPTPRERSTDSIRAFAEQYGIGQSSAYRIMKMPLRCLEREVAKAKALIQKRSGGK